MKKHLLFLGACSLLAFNSIQAQNINTKKLSPLLEKALNIGSFKPLEGFHTQNNKEGISLKSITTPQTLSVIVKAKNANQVVIDLQQKGIQCKAISDETLVADVTPQQLQILANHKDVLYVPTPRKLNLFLENTRNVTGVDKIQAGTGLETPFDGTGVLVGVIDQGFQFRHIGFLDKDGNPRAVRVWDHESKLAQPTTHIPNGSDGFGDSEGHATHVTNIAAGSKFNKFYGMAPKANIYMVPSDFQTPHILEEVKTIYDYAKSVNQPCVINMSFGAQMGPHDGSTDYDRTLSKMISEASEKDNTRLFICAANGNEGTEQIHASYDFKRASTVKLLTSANQYKKVTMGCIWSNSTDSIAHLTFRPYATQNKTTRKYLTDTQIESCGIIEKGIDPNNKKQYYIFRISQKALNDILNKLPGAANYEFGVEVQGEAGDGFHAWLEAGFGEWQVTFPQYTIDDKYLVGEGAATITQAFSVGAFQVQKFRTQVLSGPIASFSSPGPWLGEGNKPEISAPGVQIISAYNQYSNDFDPDRTTTSIDKFGKTYYYGPMSGTSMATPVVTGIIALWLQANPQLTRQQILDIFKESSIHDRYTTKAWTPTFGYGKIDAYAGIKKALELKVSGINEVNNSLQPLTISKKQNQWRVLFNNNESFANIKIYSTTGQLVMSKNIINAKQGQEEVINFNTLTPGVYIISLQTTKANYTRKIMVGK